MLIQAFAAELAFAWVDERIVDRFAGPRQVERSAISIYSQIEFT